MPRPKSLLKTIDITTAGKAHNCKANKSHKIVKGDRRLTIKEGQSVSNYCLDCGRHFIGISMDNLKQISEEIS